MKLASSRSILPLFAAAAFAAALTAAPQRAAADTVLITGANSGIGLEFTKEYAAQGWTVIATHRRSSTPESLAEVVAKYPNVRVERLDVTDIPGTKALAEKLKDVPIDVLLNNAGVYNDRRGCHDESCPGNWSTQTFGKLDYTLFDTIMAVNVKGPLIVSEAFLPNVRASKQKKIVCISSTNGSLTDQLPGAGALFYRASKAALNREMQLVARQEQPEGVTVLLLHPGAVVTERQSYLEGAKGMVEMPFTVKHMIATIDKVTIADTGKFLVYDGTTAPW
ncbi:MAG TPA: SDR family oxidoreductase [Gammaproteobacteria bacterium]|nr:SDR family oxidoreductase [Gammaproteobacteria bacterium]